MKRLTKRPSFFRRIKLRWDFEWRFIPRNISNGIRNLWRYRKVVWNDYDWDHTSLLIMMKTKIDFMADYHERRKFYENWEHNVKWMRTTSRLISNLLDSKYTNEVLDHFEIEWIESKVDEESELYQYKTRTVWETYIDYLNKYPLQKEYIENEFESMRKRKPDYNDVDDKFYLSHLLSTRNEKRAYSLLYKILYTHLTLWWD